jgi:hypothetical protein
LRVGFGTEAGAFLGWVLPRATRAHSRLVGYRALTRHDDGRA